MVPRTQVHWQLITLLRDIILFYTCDTIYKGELVDIQTKVHEFQKLYFENFVKTGIDTFKFKVHNPVHYNKSTDCDSKIVKITNRNLGC